jgi:hypothetical protein
MDATIQEKNLPQAVPKEAQEPPPSVRNPADKTPPDFYAEITRRVDVRVILQELATG